LRISDLVSQAAIGDPVDVLPLARRIVHEILAVAVIDADALGLKSLPAPLAS
jgi:hypothetical protein